ncbi:hypothetical protein QBC44DRAFT_391530 [Cladorrhinum sp. PSN332]|nr:hypothetical protein QBC44DRAFT_391530 [Cladorrhinum sp. PSN332]
MSSPNQPNEYPPAYYPETAQECWDMGGRWYDEWHALQGRLPHVRQDFEAIRVQAENAQRQINRDAQGSQRQRAVTRRHAAVIRKWTSLKQALRRNSWLRESMKGLGKYMERNALVYPDDTKTFPLLWE